MLFQYNSYLNLLSHGRMALFHVFACFHMGYSYESPFTRKTGPLPCGAKVLWKPLPAIFYFLSCQDFATANKQKRLLPFAVRCAFHLLPSISRCGSRWCCMVVGDGGEVLLSATPQTQSFLGRMAERFIAAVLKTAVGKTTRGSNPFPSANFCPPERLVLVGFLLQTH